MESAKPSESNVAPNYGRHTFRSANTGIEIVGERGLEVEDEGHGFACDHMATLLQDIWLHRSF